MPTQRFVFLALCMFASPVFAQAPSGPAAVAPASDTAPDKSGYTLFNPTPASAMRDFSTDRPTKGVSPVTLDAGHVQIETDLFAYTHAKADGVTTRLYTAFDPVVVVGVTDHIDIEAQFNGYNWLTTSGGGTRTQRQSGAGDLYLRTKFNLFGNEGGPAMALVPYVKVATAPRGLGNRQTEGGVIAPITYPLPLDFTLLIMPEVDVMKNGADMGHHFSYTQLINIGHPIGPKVTVYGELYSALGTDAHTPPVYTIDAAVAWIVADNAQLDLGVNIGLNKASPNLQVYTGLSKRF